MSALAFIALTSRSALPVSSPSLTVSKSSVALDRQRDRRSDRQKARSDGPRRVQAGSRRLLRTASKPQRSLRLRLPRATRRGPARVARPPGPALIVAAEAPQCSQGHRSTSARLGAGLGPLASSTGPSECPLRLDRASLVAQLAVQRAPQAGTAAQAEGAPRSSAP